MSLGVSRIREHAQLGVLLASRDRLNVLLRVEATKVNESKVFAREEDVAKGLRDR
jgi:hypothetical protein